MRAREILRLLLALVVLGALSPQPGRAQGAGASFQCYTTEQGLSHNEVLALAKDRRGFLWVGTASGLNRFDGVQFKTYTYTGRADGLPSNYIMHNGLVADPRGYLWLSTNQGLYRFDSLRERGVTVPLPTPANQPAANDLVSPIDFDRAGQGWFATWYRRLTLTAPGRGGLPPTLPVPHRPAQPAPDAVSAAVSGAGRLSRRGF